MINKLNSFVFRFAKNNFSIFLRKILNIRYPAIDLQYNEVSSDLFFWKCSNEWETFFNIYHLGPIISPNFKESYNGIIEFYDKNGNIIHRSTIKLKYGKNNLLTLNKLLINLDLKDTYGTFSVFHDVPNNSFYKQNKICIAERGAVSYRKKNDGSLLRSYVHGNINASAMNIKTKNSRVVGLEQKKIFKYRFQLNLDDAVKSEIILINFLSRAASVKIFTYYDKKKKLIRENVISPRGCSTLFFDESKKNNIIEIESKINFLRPLLFKYYNHHFDVLHG